MHNNLLTFPIAVVLALVISTQCFGLLTCVHNVKSNQIKMTFVGSVDLEPH